MGKKKKIIGILAALLAVFSVMTGLAAEEERESGPVSLEVTSAYGGMGKIGCSIPLTVKLYGQSESPFRGTFHVSSLESGSDGKEERYDYSWKVAVNPAETKRMELYVPLGQKSGRLYFTLKDETGKTMGEASMDFDISRESGGFLIGSLSEQPEELAWLDAVSLNYGMVESRLLPLTAEQIPENGRGLDMLDMLVINRFGSETLTETQREAVLSWVNEGGILLFGTGQGGMDSLYGFTDGLVKLPLGKPELLSITMGAEYAKNMPMEAEVSAYVRKLEIPAGEERLVSDGIPLLTMVQRGQGEIGVFSVDPAEFSEFAKNNPAYGMQLLTEILGEKRVYNLYYNNAYGEDSDYWNAQSLVSGGNAGRLPNLPLYGVVMVIYIGLVGPGLYLLFKRRELSRYYNLAAMALSVAACGVVYFLGSQTRFTSAFSTTATILDVDGGKAKELTYLNIRTPDSRGFSVKVPAEYQVTPLTRSSRYDTVPLVEFEKKKTASLGLRFEEDGTVLWSRKSRAFDSKYFLLNRTGYLEEGQGIASDLEIFDGKVSGYVQNNFPDALEDAALFLYGQVLPLGRLEPGERREFSEEPLLTWPVGLPWLLAETLTEGADKERDTDQEYLENMEKTSLYSFFATLYYGSYHPEVRLGAMGPAGSLGGNLSFGGEDDGMVFYTAALNASNTRDGFRYQNGQVRAPRFTSGSGGDYGSSSLMYGTEPMVAEYFLGNGTEVETLSFLPASEVFFENPQYAYLKRFSGQAYFYNLATESYDPVNLEQVDFSESDLLPYLSPEGSLKVKYVGGESAEAGISQVLPLLMVTGRER